jgi:hypothetical protein
VILGGILQVVGISLSDIEKQEKKKARWLYARKNALGKEGKLL